MKGAMPQLWPEILFSGSGWPLRRKLKAAFLDDEQKGGYPQNGPFSTNPAGYPPSDDPLFKVSEGRPLRPNCIHNGGVPERAGW